MTVVPVTLPSLGEAVTEGTITRWHAAIGDEVTAGTPLYGVSTDKVDTEVPAPVTGTLVEITVAEDQTVDVGTRVAAIAVAAGPGAPHLPAAPPQPESNTMQVVTSDIEHALADNDRGPMVSPLVRKLARELGIDLADVQGTGVGGRVTKADLTLAAASAIEAPPRVNLAPARSNTAPARRDPKLVRADPVPAAPAAPTESATTPVARVEPLTRRRRVVATRMVEALQTAAQLTTVVEVDLTAVAALRRRLGAAFEQATGVRLTYTPFLALATVEALQQHPLLNASIDMDRDEVRYHAHLHLGIAVDAPDGLIVPVVPDAGALNLVGLAQAIADRARHAREGTLTPDEVSGATFTLTNTGSRGALFDTPILTPPQTGILGTGAVVKRVRVVSYDGDGESLAVRHICHLALSYDHRLVDGADAARFLATMRTRLQAGQFELLLPAGS